jgi:uncharacterized membrane protein YciS (DUF1049 family)
VYRIGFFIVVVLAIALGVVVGTLNPTVVPVDLLWAQLNWPLGLTLICALVFGILAGLALSWLFTVLPLRMRLRRAEKGLQGIALTPSDVVIQTENTTDSANV